jgi:hypothetical protein
MPTHPTPRGASGKTRSEGRAGRAEVAAAPNENASREVPAVESGPGGFYIDVAPDEPRQKAEKWLTNDQAERRAAEAKEDDD